MPENTPGIVRWSTWSGAPTSDGQNVTIPAGTAVLLDVSPKQIYLLDIFGTLVFDPSPSANLQLDAFLIEIESGGALWVGSEQSPALGNITIQMHGTRQPKVSPYGTGTKCLGVVPGGLLEMHGAPVSPSWTLLNGTVQANATSITLAEPVSWAVGTQFVISTTDFEEVAPDPNNRQRQSENRTITAVSADRRTLTFAPPLAYMHYGEIYRPAPNAPDAHLIDMRAAVGSLTRNVHFHGDGDASGWGGHIMVLAETTVHISDIEVTDAGQALELGRYPIHFHVASNMNGSYVRNVAIHHVNQRCLTVHGSDYLLVKDNVCYHTHGHAYFIEDGNEEGNVYDHNVAIHAISHTLLAADIEPACYWVTNPANHFYNNRAAGCSFGWWYAMPMHPLGYDRGDDLYLRFLPMGDHKRNTANSCERGVQIDQGQMDQVGNFTQLTSFTPRDWSTSLRYRNISVLDTFDDYGRGVFGVPVFAVFEEFTAFKHTDNGFWTRGDHVLVTGAKFADNRVGSTMPGEDNVVQNSIYVGDTDNVGTVQCVGCPPWVASNGDRTRPLTWWLDAPIVGWSNYDASGGDMCINNTFYNYNNYQFATPQLNRTRSAGAIGTLCSINVLDTNQVFAMLSFVNVENNVYIYKDFPQWNATTMTTTYIDYTVASDSSKGVAMNDLDGSITGQCGALVVGLSDHLHYPGCTLKSAWNAWVCPPDPNNGIRGFFFGDESGTMVTGTAASTATLTSLTTQKFVTIQADPQYGGSVLDDSSVFTLQWGTNVVVNDAFFFAYGPDAKMVSKFDVEIGRLMRGERVRLALPFAAGTTFSVTYNYGSTAVPGATSIANLGTATPWFFDNGAALLWLHFENDGTADAFEYRSYLKSYPQQASYARFVVQASSAGAGDSAALARAAANAAAIAGAVGAGTARPDSGLCGKHGAMQTSGGVMSYAATTPASGALVIFDEALDANWSVWAQTCNATTSDAFSGTTSLLCDYTTQSWWGMGWKTWQSATLPSTAGFTHLTLAAKSAPGFGDGGNLAVQLTHVNADSSKNISGVAGADTQVVSPKFSAAAYINEAEWTVFTIPLADMHWTYDTLTSFSISTPLGRPYKVLIDSVQFVQASSSVAQMPNFLTTVPVPPPVSTYNYLASSSSSSAPTPSASPSNCAVGSAGCACGASGACSGALVCVDGATCAFATCDVQRVAGCACGSGSLCVQPFACGSNGFCAAMSIGGSGGNTSSSPTTCVAGSAGCQCTSAMACSSANTMCVANVCQLVAASCVPGTLGCACAASGACTTSASSCLSSSNLCVVARNPSLGAASSRGASVAAALLLAMLATL